MAAKTVKCAKLKQELPGIDPDAPDGDRALKMALLIGGPEMQQRIRGSISARAWEMWTDHMLMVVNEYHLDPTSDEANEVLKPHLEAFFLGEQAEVPGYVPPDSGSQ
jgi:Fe-S cluster biosynthesis and repair protein YggX